MQARIATPGRVKPRIKESVLLEFPFVALGEDAGSEKPAENKLAVISHLS
jgi:hypothetical protein